MAVDFHMHTTYSDGTMSPKALASLAHKRQVTTIAITDHDEIGGGVWLREHPVAGVTVVPGVEFSATFHGKDVHILGYAIDTANKRLLDYIRFFKEERRTRIIKMITKCQQAGYDVSVEDLMTTCGEHASYGRPHLARLLISKGYVTDINEAFATVLHPKSPCYVPKFTAHPTDILDIIREAGGIGVLAHPVLIRNDAYVTELLDMPFDGMECYHPKQDEEATARYLAMAKERSLLISGGSDFHGIPNRYPSTLGEFLITPSMVSEFMRALGLRPGV